MRARAEALRREGRTLALAPTMGGLHEGHLALVRAARSHGDHVTVSIFVNPTQFGPEEDYADYPRDLAGECAALTAQGGVDVVFAPSAEELYPGGAKAQRVWVDSPELSAHLCGRHRPGHFRGVLTVVTKLFQCCLPHAALFGLKDAQQYFILRKLSRDLLLGVRIVGVETVREPDGLALSSRNAYLSQEERAQAVVLSRAVREARRAIEAGERRPTAVVEAMARMISEAPAAKLQYAEVVGAQSLQPMERIAPGQEVLAAVAAFLGAARLIDNAIVRAPKP